MAKPCHSTKVPRHLHGIQERRPASFDTDLAWLITIWTAVQQRPVSKQEIAHIRRELLAAYRKPAPALTLVRGGKP
jgi:hypothetical protein